MKDRLRDHNMSLHNDAKKALEADVNQALETGVEGRISYTYVIESGKILRTHRLGQTEAAGELGRKVDRGGVGSTREGYFS